MTIKRICDRFFSPFHYDVHGEQGGISTAITLPGGFDPRHGKCHMVVLMHGFMSNKKAGLLVSISEALAREGIASVRFDFNAHGKSEGDFVRMTISNEISDARAVVDHVLSLPYVSSISFAGHSQGGVVAGMLAGMLEEDERRRPLCLVQLAPAAVLKDDALAGKCMLSRYDASSPPEYVNVMGHRLGRAFIVEAQRLPIYETSMKYSGPVCLIHGKKDKIVPYTYSGEYHDAYPNSTLNIIEDEGHLMNKRTKEIVQLVVRHIKQNLNK